MVKNRLDDAFKRVKREGRKALVAYLAGGYPPLKEQERLIPAIVNAGVDVLEIGIPFSDPVADGRTIQFASFESLKHGASVKKILPLIARLTRTCPAPVVVMTYLNPIVAYGVDRFARDARKAGVTGLIVPDLVPEEAGELKGALDHNNLHFIHMVAPTTPPDRLRRIAKQSTGFLYAVSVTGVTGARTKHAPETRRWLKRLQNISPHPVCVGFGISTPEHIRQLRGSVDGFIVGSALIDVIRKNKPNRRAKEAARFIGALAKECSHGR